MNGNDYSLEEINKEGYLSELLDCLNDDETR